MKSLYQYLTEGWSKYMTYDDLISISTIYKETHDELHPENKPEKPLFILKSAEPNRLCIRDVYRDEAFELIRKVFGVDEKDVNLDNKNNGVINSTKGNYKPIKIHITNKNINGVKIETREQETATCIVFNMVVNEYTKEQYTMGLNKKAILKMLKDDLGVEFDDTGWYETFALQVDKIINALGGIDEAKKYRMERFGGHPKYKPEDWNLWPIYHRFVLEYTRFMGGKKDNWDPTDVVLYKKESEKKLSEIFNNLYNRIRGLQPGDRIEFVADELRNLYRDPIKPFMGISLKKLGKSASFEMYNMSEGDRIQIKESGEVNYRRSGKAAYVNLKGSYKFEDMIISGDVSDVKSHEIKLEMRTFGAGINALDVTLESGPSIGKCPTNIWTKILNVDSTDSIENCIDAFAKFIEKHDIQNTNILVQAAAKNGPHCLPFILIH